MKLLTLERFVLLILYLFLLLQGLSAQTVVQTLEFASGAGNPVGIGGPTTSSQVITFMENNDNPVANTFVTFSRPTSTATFSLGNFQYRLNPTQTYTLAPLVMGGTTTGSTDTISPFNFYSLMSAVGGAVDSDFTSAGTIAHGTGMEVTLNYATEFYTSAMGMYNAGSPTLGIYYIGDVTVTFNALITNPVIHVFGLGATDGAMGLTTELVLATSGITLTRLSGSPEFAVHGDSIVNTAAAPTASTGAGAASGSALATGTNIRTLTFHVYLRANGLATAWSATGNHVGDAWMMGISAILSEVVSLPLTISNFSVTLQNDVVQLQWTATREEGDLSFVVESSTDGKSWQDIGTVPIDSSFNIFAGYQFADNHPAQGLNYYRIEEVYAGGSSSYSPVATAWFGPAAGARVFPNPVINQLYFSNTGGDLLLSVNLVNVEGKIIGQYGASEIQRGVDMSGLAKGIYFAVLQYASGQSDTEKILKN